MIIIICTFNITCNCIVVVTRNIHVLSYQITSILVDDDFWLKIISYLGILVPVNSFSSIINIFQS